MIGLVLLQFAVDNAALLTSYGNDSTLLAPASDYAVVETFQVGANEKPPSVAKHSIVLLSLCRYIPCVLHEVCYPRLIYLYIWSIRRLGSDMYLRSAQNVLDIYPNNTSYQGAQ